MSNKSIKKLSTFFSLGMLSLGLTGATFTNLSAVGANTILTSLIAADGTSVGVTLKNQNQFPIVCDQLNVAITLSDGEFDLPLGKSNYNFNSIYLKPHAEWSQDLIGQEELTELRKRTGGAKIINTDPEMLNCHPANLQEYCEYAPLSSAEKFTLGLIKRIFATQTCDELNGDYTNAITLSNSGVEDLTVFSFFGKLEHLDLRYNKISNLEPLAGLEHLRMINLEGNPIQNIDPLLKLPLIETVCIGDTPVFSSMAVITKPFTGLCR